MVPANQPPGFVIWYMNQYGSKQILILKYNLLSDSELHHQFMLQTCQSIKLILGSCGWRYFLHLKVWLFYCFKDRKLISLRMLSLVLLSVTPVHMWNNCWSQCNYPSLKCMEYADFFLFHNKIKPYLPVHCSVNYGKSSTQFICF